MAKTICQECGFVLRSTATIEEARRLAVLHMSFTPHILVFGYSDNDAETIIREQNIKDRTEG